ncbi:MAG: hypothetical protein ABI700_19875, partial [Chloroflexota bacterium]
IFAPPMPSMPRPIPAWKTLYGQPEMLAETEPITSEANELAQEFPLSTWVVLLQWVMRIAALGLAVVGGLVMLSSPVRSEASGLNVGAPYLLAGFLLWLLGEFVPPVFDRRPRPRRAVLEIPRESLLTLTPVRWLAFTAGLGTSVLAWFLNGGNMFTFFGVIAWFASIIFWVWALAPKGWSPSSGLASAGKWLLRARIRLNWTLLFLIAIMAIAGYFRLNDLSSTPPEMTSDHVEKLLDVNRVLHGETNVFFANNHGRDAIQFYTLALLSYIPGLDLNFTLLKLLTIIEGMITLPVLWWMGREVIGKDEPRLGNALGLTIAALVAVSYWHEMLSRLGLRIVLTPLFMALAIIFLARALRYNRRSDFIYTGIVLGVGIYAYQAIRMLPVVIVVAVVMALIFWVRSMQQRRQMLMNLVALVLVSFVIFVPLFRYSLEYPEDFWRRTSGRLFGDTITETTDANGNLIARTPTVQDELVAFNKNMPVLLDNFRNALLMFNWKGDVAWINNAPNEPALDVVTGGLLIVGLAAWLGRMFRRRDVFDWALLPLILIMMLPSALSIAYPIENPSATRMSGTLPGVYILAALPLALIALTLPRLIGRIGAVLALVGVSALVFVSYSINQQTYFQDYRTAYIANSLPYSVGGQVMRQFALDNGYGNAFILAYPYWWDHRALAIDAGRIDWANTILKLEDVPAYLQQAFYRKDDLRLNPTKDMLFFYSPDDTQSQVWLQQNFPLGYWQNVTTYQPGHSFNLYRVPAPGVDYFAHFLQRYGLSQP